MSKPEPAPVCLGWPDQHRALRLPEPEIHDLQAEDGTALRLVRYNGGDAGPVIFAHGNGTSNRLALLDTIDTNLAEYLVGRGHDLWLFEWRGSPELAVPSYSLHDAARHDWPAAVAYVTGRTGAAQVDCVVFCAAGITLLIALAAGRLGGRVRSAVLVSASLAFSMPWLARLKAVSRLAETVDTLGWRTYRQDARKPAWPYRLLDAALKLHPVNRHDRCDSPSCQRMVFCYGPAAHHPSLNAATHERLPSLFGAASLRSVRDLAGAVREGWIVPLDDAAVENLRLPLTFIHGAENRLVLPASSQRLHDALAARNGSELYEIAVVPDYGHFDSLAGEQSARDVFPIVGGHLDRWRSKAPVAA